MSVVLVTGGSGTFGRAVVPLLAERGHEVRVLSRRPGRGTHLGDLEMGEGVAEAAAGADLVVHAASDARHFGKTDPDQTRNLLAAIGDCRHLVYLSIVGIEAIPTRYYRAKLACEQLIKDGPAPWTILRATQFHQLIAMGLRTASRLPIAPLPLAFRFQSVAAAEVAARVADLLDGEPLGRAPDFGGPEVLTARQLIATWRERHGQPRYVVGVRWPGPVYRGFAQGRNTCPDRTDGRQTWSDFVASVRSLASGNISGG
jgi:uncharacterized protein YbjT (DUF2867 family)